MNYYIQGSPTRAEQIKTALKKLGYDTSGHLFNANSVLYFTLDGEIRATTCNCTPAIIKTHPDYKELELPIEPCFKVGDKIRSKLTQITYTINEIDIVNNRYKLDYCSVLDFKAQDKFELAPNPHYDISSFKPFDKVLVRDRYESKWGNTYFGFYDEEQKVFVCDCYEWEQCIPYNDDTKHLLGTTDPCDEMYINW